MTKTTVLQPLCQLQALPLDEIIFSKSLQQTGASLKKKLESKQNGTQVKFNRVLLETIWWHIKFQYRLLALLNAFSFRVSICLKFSEHRARYLHSISALCFRKCWSVMFCVPQTYGSFIPNKTRERVEKIMLTIRCTLSFSHYSLFLPDVLKYALINYSKGYMFNN